MGTGKTIIYLTVIYMWYLRCQHDQTIQDSGGCLPTLVFVPASLVSQTFKEAVTNFPALDVKCYYGSAEACAADAPRAAATLTQSQFHATLTKLAANKSDPKSAGTVIITSYSTFLIRETEQLDEIHDAEKVFNPWYMDEVTNTTTQTGDSNGDTIDDNLDLGDDSQ
ncbi:hypothetical protein MCOR34_011387 [Pyricularia oryzae]|nr:hypothetical protein MCOR34_011387 [Pyricularia oryzae]